MRSSLVLGVALVVFVVGCQSASTPESSSTSEPKAAAAEATFASANAVITQNCAGCHSGAGAKKGIQLDSHENIVKSVTPGDATASLIVKAMKGDGVDQMPPGKTLPADQVAIVEAWIAAGAKP